MSRYLMSLAPALIFTVLLWLAISAWIRWATRCSRTGHLPVKVNDPGKWGSEYVCIKCGRPME